jgi:6-pyruvoyltetrahydropterin/6-carboxytetrahydropterin synthase
VRKDLTNDFSIRVYKQYFNFASGHFLIFPDGSREPLHGHNYRVQLQGSALDLHGDMVFDFLHIKPIVRDLCNELDHRLLLPSEHPLLRYEERGHNIRLYLPDGGEMEMPKSDCLWLPLPNTSAERLAVYLAHQIKERVFKQYQFRFTQLEIEVEETPGQCAVYRLTEPSFHQPLCE